MVSEIQSVTEKIKPTRVRSICKMMFAENKEISWNWKIVWRKVIDMCIKLKSTLQCAPHPFGSNTWKHLTQIRQRYNKRSQDYFQHSLYGFFLYHWIISLGYKNFAEWQSGEAISFKRKYLRISIANRTKLFFQSHENDCCFLCLSLRLCFFPFGYMYIDWSFFSIAWEKKSFTNSSICHKFCLRTCEKFENAKQSQCGDKLCDLFEKCVLEWWWFNKCTSTLHSIDR